MTILILVFLFGLIVGSFLNAVIYRLWSGETILFDRSHCPHCKHELSALDLIPLFSFMALGGRCRYCSKKISWQYPLIELATAVSFILLAQNFQSSIFNLQFLAQIIFICFLIVIGVFDFKHYLILDKVVYPAFILAIIFNLLLGQDYLVSGVFGAILVSGFFEIQYLLSQGRWIGFGDVKLGLFLGMLLGLKSSLLMLMIAYFVGAFVGVALVMMDRKKFSSKLPFGVFLSISAIIMLLYGDRVISWYFSLIGLS
jgi:leader peptidase (prepilin peptidase) / N-methyltransferase